MWRVPFSLHDDAGVDRGGGGELGGYPFENIF